MGRLPWFQYYPGDFTRDTLSLTTVSVGAWIRILNYLWDQNPRGVACRPIPSWGKIVGLPVPLTVAVFYELLDNRICEIEGLGPRPENWVSGPASGPAIVGPCEGQNEGVIIRDGNVMVMSRRIAREEKARQNHRLSQDRYRSKEVSDRNVIECDRDVICRSQKSEVRNPDSSQNQNPDSLRIPPPGSTVQKPPNPTAVSVSRFEEFWVEFPRKEKKAGARKVFEKIPPLLVDEVLAALRKQKAWRMVPGGAWEDHTKIPHPTSWLNQKRWEDETVETVKYHEVPPGMKCNVMVNYGTEEFPKRDLCGEPVSGKQSGEFRQRCEKHLGGGTHGDQKDPA